MRSLLIIASALAACLSHDVRSTVYQVLPSTEQELRLLKELEESGEYDFWTDVKQVNVHVDVLVNQKNQEKFVEFLANSRISYDTLILDVERVIEEQRVERLRAPRLREGEISFTNYHTYEEIQAYLHKLAKTHKHVSVETFGQSYEGRDLNVIKISSDPSANKPIVVVDAEIHAREWIAPATALYLINQLAENATVSWMLDKVDWYIVPTLNPDGYAFTFSKERLWRKTRSQTYCSYCNGTDANRNFNFHWDGPGSSQIACGETYRGPGPFSEKETKHFADFLTGIKDRIKVYVTLHSYANVILIPWGYTVVRPDDYEALVSLGKAAAKKIQDHSGTVYNVGTVPELMYEASGSSMDWAKGAIGVQFAYTLELPGKGHGFLLPPEYILPIAQETFCGFEAFHDHVAKNH